MVWDLFRGYWECERNGEKKYNEGISRFLLFIYLFIFSSADPSQNYWDLEFISWLQLANGVVLGSWQGCCDWLASVCTESCMSACTHKSEYPQIKSKYWRIRICAEDFTSTHASTHTGTVYLTKKRKEKELTPNRRRRRKMGWEGWGVKTKWIVLAPSRLLMRLWGMLLIRRGPFGSLSDGNVVMPQ